MQQGKKVTIGCTMLAGTNKQGVLRPDEHGYYRTPMGAYGGQNSAGFVYDAQSGRSMFSPGSVLMRKIEKGVLYGEYKHPKREHYMSDQQYVARIRDIDDDRRAFHVRKVELVPSRDEHGRPITLVIGEVKPCGPFGHVVKASLENPHENTFFSVRSITMDDMMRGVKYTKEIVTWDYVGEGGIYVANKYNSPSLESFTDTEIEITPTMLWSLADEQRKANNMGLENSAASYDDLLKTLGWSRTPQRVERPAFMKW
jgi:hypothetical protein